MDKLAIPASAADLYLYRGAEVSACRPVMTGDVFADIEIPGVDDGPGLALVLAHPCSMRAAGGHLRDKVMMCRVSDGSGIPLVKWAEGFYGVMPLPDLHGAPSLGHRATFELAGRVATAQLDSANRVACLDERGITLLLQRLVFSHTRAAIEPEVIHESVAPVLVEAELLERWVEARTLDVGLPASAAAIRAAEAEFEAFMSAVDAATGLNPRKQLLDPAARASVRRLVAKALAA
jgi:hypothetical protein